MPPPARTHLKLVCLLASGARKLPEILSVMPMVGRFVAVLLLTWSMSATALPGDENFPAQSSRDQPKAQKLLALKMLAGLLNGADANRDDDAARPDFEDLLERKVREDSGMMSQSPHVGPRDRKAPCKNFFWKTYSTC
ncbi:somatostatin-2-like [Vipera latastei]